MAIIESLALVLIAALITYNIKRTDHVDSRLDMLNERLIRLEANLPKRKNDYHGFYSENSGIEL